jgi:hypothetical protein
MPRLWSLIISGFVTAGGLSAAPDLFDGFSGDWRQAWRVEKLFAKATTYAVERDPEMGPVLHARSDTAHAALVRKVPIATPTRARLAWSWKVAEVLKPVAPERTREGDDYCARVFVIFETSLWPLRTRAINYVWSAREPVGSIYPSPYTANVGMVVLRSGNADAGVWQHESRDVLADYRTFFGEAATGISAVAVLVDTDNTRQSTEAWFARLSLDPAPRWANTDPAP